MFIFVATEWRQGSIKTRKYLNKTEKNKNNEMP